ncbi:MAG TPA: hypothetical protein VLC09_08505 [Polyangiaceae bacterium]|nr:hypothetical protein [Polyangiaceae bacterium]
MNREAIERVLGIVRQELACESARIELGGPPPDSSEVLCTQLPSGFRLVVTFREPPLDRASANLRLRQLASSFFDASIVGPSVRPNAEQHLSQRRLDDELYALAGRTGAAGAVVFDAKSPVIWGCSEGRSDGDDIEAWIETARIQDLAQSHSLDLVLLGGLSDADRRGALEGLGGEDRARLDRLLDRLYGRTLKARRTYLQRALVVRDVRRLAQEADITSGGLRRFVHGPEVAYFARSLAGIYILQLHFPAPYSELHVEGMALHALPVLEKLVLSLPSVDPPPSGGKVVPLPAR